MAVFEYNNIHIGGIACATPTNEVDTLSYSDAFEREDLLKFIDNTGVEKKRDRIEKQTTADLCFVAAKKLLEHKKIDATDIDALVFITQTPDYIQPATAHVLHKRLGLSIDCMAYDVNLGCSGYIYGLQMCSAMLQCGSAKRILLLTGEVLRKHTGDMTKNDLLFGNAGSATILERGNDRLRCLLRSDGSDYDILIIPGGGMRNPTLTIDDYVKLSEPQMDGAAVFQFSIAQVPKAFKSFFAEFGASIEDYDYVVLHQANLFMLKHIAKKIKVPEGRLPISIDRYGNTSSASIPQTIVDICEGIDNRELKLIMSGFGIGLSWGVADVNVNSDDVLPMIFTDEYYEEAYDGRGI